MKKFLALFVVFAAVLLVAVGAHALTIKNGPNTEQITHRYAGAIVLHDDGLNEAYWYINPATLERFELKDGITVSRLLRSQGQAISDKELNMIPDSFEDKDFDYEIFSKYSGKIVIQTEKNGEAWYVHPYDKIRYYIENGIHGFNTVETLAVDISQSKLEVFKISPSSSRIPDETVNFSAFWSALDTLKNKYYKPINGKDVVYGAISGAAKSLNDPYTEFFAPKDKEDFTDWLEGSFEGIGAVVETKNGVLEVVSPLVGSPAMSAGLQSGDQITDVNGVDIFGYSTEDAINLIKGPTGSTVKLDIFRPSTEQRLEISIVRDVINVEAVSGELKNGNVAYIKINLFSDNAAEQFHATLSNLVSENTAGIILDLRDNPGGFTAQSVNIADAWLPVGANILREVYPSTFYDYIAQSEQELNLPTVILVNGGTASASEILTLALSEYQKATVVGTQTFGKGTGQFLENYEDGSALKYTGFEWLSSDENSIEGLGITPDFVVENSENYDDQLRKALQILQ